MSIILIRLDVVQKKLFSRTANLVHIYFRFLFTLNTYIREQYLLKGIIMRDSTNYTQFKSPTSSPCIPARYTRKLLPCHHDYGIF